MIAYKIVGSEEAKSLGLIEAAINILGFALDDLQELADEDLLTS